MWAEAGFIVASYLLGSIPQVYLLGRLKGKDLRRGGDLHLSLWQSSRPLGAAGILVDLAKGPVPVLAAGWLGLDPWVRAAGGLAVVLGQMWPCYLPATGGRGNSTAMAMALALYPRSLAVASVAVVVGLALRSIPRRSLVGGAPSRSLPVAMLMAFAILPLASWALEAPAATILSFCLTFLAVVVRRLTVGLRQDWKATGNKKSILLNRFLYDRSFV